MTADRSHENLLHAGVAGLSAAQLTEFVAELSALVDLPPGAYRRASWDVLEAKYGAGAPPEVFAAWLGVVEAIETRLDFARIVQGMT